MSFYSSSIWTYFFDFKLQIEFNKFITDIFQNFVNPSQMLFKRLFLKLDLFSNPQLLRYHGEGAHQTCAGSVISLFIVVFFISFFFNYCKQTYDRSQIKNTERQQPSLGSTFNTNQSNSDFMIAIGITGIDLNANRKYFETIMYNKVYKNGVEYSSQEIKLQPCLPQQWGINEEFKNNFARLNFNQRLCPPKDYNFTFKGKITSEEHRFTKIIVRRCSIKKDQCASYWQFNDMLLKQKTFKLSVYFANPIIDASQKQYLDYVLQDSNYFEFTDMVGVSSYFLFSQYEVSTDNSILPQPSSDITIEKGLTLNQRPVVSNFEVINTDQFARIQLRKSDLIQQYNRSYTRFDATFSYLGGLFGIMLLIFCGLKAFNQSAFQFDLGSHIFVSNDKDKSKLDSSKFHIGRFLCYQLYSIVTLIHQNAKNWQSFKFYRSVEECTEEIQEQIDVQFILHRITYLENFNEILIKQLEQLSQNTGRRSLISNIRLKIKSTMNQAAEKRKNIQRLIENTQGPNTNNQLGQDNPQANQVIIQEIQMQEQVYFEQENNSPHSNGEIVRKNDFFKQGSNSRKRQQKEKEQSSSKPRIILRMQQLIQMQQNKENAGISPFNQGTNKNVHMARRRKR